MPTNCEFPPELDDKQLLTYLDDREENRETALHLEKCSYCREKALALDRLQKRMTSRLYRITCPSPTELGEYHLRMLAPPQMLIISQHLRECPHCTREISQLVEFMGELAPQPDLLKSARALIARQVKEPRMGQDSEGFLGAPAFSGLRGEEEEPFIYQANGIQIVIEVQDDMERPDRKTLLGLITGLKTNGFTMEAYQKGKLVATTLVDEIGNFIFSQFLPGSYELILLGPDTEILIRSFIV